MVDEELSFTVSRYTLLGSCSITLTKEECKGLKNKEIERLVREHASEVDVWQEYPYEDQDILEVDWD